MATDEDALLARLALADRLRVAAVDFGLGPCAELHASVHANPLLWMGGKLVSPVEAPGLLVADAATGVDRDSIQAPPEIPEPGAKCLSGLRLSRRDHRCLAVQTASPSAKRDNLSCKGANCCESALVNIGANVRTTWVGPGPRALSGTTTRPTQGSPDDPDERRAIQLEGAA
jgi:hypothetical protein